MAHISITLLSRTVSTHVSRILYVSLYNSKYKQFQSSQIINIRIYFNNSVSVLTGTKKWKIELQLKPV